jgi:hypothetical protein
MTSSDPDKRLRDLIAKAFVPPDVCETDAKAIEAMLDAANAEPFTDEQVERILKKAKGELPIGKDDDEPEGKNVKLTEEEESLVALHRGECGKLHEEILEKLRRFRETARRESKEENGSGK